MHCQTYRYPEPAVPTGPQAYTVCARLPHRSPCRPPGLLTAPCAGWAAQRCPADADYQQPLADGDVLYFQFQLPDAYNPPNATPTHGWRLTGTALGPWLLALAVLGPDGQDLTPGSFDAFAQGWVATTVGGQRYQGLRVQTHTLPSCFRLKITHNTPAGPVDYYTELYHRDACQPTVLLRGAANGSSVATCDGFLLGPTAPPDLWVLGTYFGHEFRLRLPAELAWVGTDLAQTRLKNNLPIRTERTERYRLRSQRLPPAVVRTLHQLLAAPTLWANGIELRFEGTLGRNADRGTMWLIDAELTTPPCTTALLPC